MNEIKDFPVVMTAEHVATILGISKWSAYEVMETKGFPLVRIGRLKRVQREAFFQWLQSQKIS